MSSQHLRIDWYADGFEVRLEGGEILGPLPVLVAIGGGFLTMAALVGSIDNPAGDAAVPWLLGMGGVGLFAMFGGGFAAGVLSDNRPVRVIEVTQHRLAVRRGNDTIELDTALERVTHVGLVGRDLWIRSADGELLIDGSNQVHETMEELRVALKAAVAARSTPETPEDQREREQALAQLAALRQRQ